MLLDATNLTDEVVEKTNVFKEYLNDAIPVALTFVIHVIIAAIILFVGLKIIKGIVKVLRKYLNKSRIESGVVGFLCSLLRWILIAVLVMIILSQFGVTTGSVVAVLGSAGLTIGLALQGSLANFAGGVLILLIKPFVVGDYIIDKSSGLEGSVKDITIFYTILTTVDNKEVSIPNGSLSNSSIVNVTKNPVRRIEINAGVAYDSDLKLVKEVLLQIANEHENVLKDHDINAFVAELEDSSIKMELRVWVKTENYWQTKWDITEQIKEEFAKNNIQIPFPQLDVLIKK